MVIGWQGLLLYSLVLLYLLIVNAQSAYSPGSNRPLGKRLIVILHKPPASSVDELPVLLLDALGDIGLPTVCGEVAEFCQDRI